MEIIKNPATSKSITDHTSLSKWTGAIGLKSRAVKIATQAKIGLFKPKDTQAKKAALPVTTHLRKV